MKSKLIAGAIFVGTVATVVLFPPHQTSGAITTSTIALPVVNPTANIKRKIEVVFVLDTTSSMSGLIAAAKEKIWSIATTMASAESAPEISHGAGRLPRPRRCLRHPGARPVDRPRHDVCDVDGLQSRGRR